MRIIRTLPFLFALALLACSGSLGPGPAGGSSDSLGKAPPPGGGQYAAAPGTEEVQLGPGVDPQGKGYHEFNPSTPINQFKASMTCELQCESADSALQLRVKGLLKIDGEGSGDRLLRIVEHFGDDDSRQYQEVKTDAQGNLSFVITGPKPRVVEGVYLLKHGDNEPLDKILPCPDSSCIPEISGDSVKDEANAVAPVADCRTLYEDISSDSYCKSPFHLPTDGKVFLPTQSGSRKP